MVWLPSGGLFCGRLVGVMFCTFLSQTTLRITSDSVEVERSLFTNTFIQMYSLNHQIRLNCTGEKQPPSCTKYSVSWYIVSHYCYVYLFDSKSVHVKCFYKSFDSSHECIILDVIHHVLIYVHVQFKNIREILLASVDYEAGLESLIETTTILHKIQRVMIYCKSLLLCVPLRL
jgi:hypothetical protein